MTSKSVLYMRKWHKKNPGYKKQWYDANMKKKDTTIVKGALDMKVEKEKMDKEAHRKTIFSAGAKREGLMDKPYDEGEVL